MGDKDSGNIAVLMFPLVFLVVLLRAFVFFKLWGWFIEPAFMFPCPGYACCLGLTFVVDCFGSIKRTSDEDQLYWSFVYFVGLCFILMCGFLVKGFV